MLNLLCTLKISLEEGVEEGEGKGVGIRTEGCRWTDNHGKLSPSNVYTVIFAMV